MKRLRPWAAIVVAVIAFAWERPTLSQTGSSNPHAYFQSLLARPELWQSYSLRDQAELLQYKNAGSIQPFVTYDPATDTYPARQDAAKIVIPEFQPWQLTQVAQPIAPGDTSIVLRNASAAKSSYSNGKTLRIGSEVMVVVRPSGSVIANDTVTVKRGQWGTTPQAHAVNTPVYQAPNSLPNQLRLPLGTQDGHSYLFTWDAWYGPEYVNAGLSNHKAWQFSQNNDKVWFQINTNYTLGGSADIGGIDFRTGGAVGPNVVRSSPLQPQQGQFTIKPQTWTRYWVLVDQRAGDYELVSVWAADERTDPVLLLDQRQIALPNTGGTIAKFWIEFNTSTVPVKPWRGDLVAYARNFVALRDVVNPTALMIRPNSTAPLPPVTALPPSAPTNLRIVVR